MGKIRINDTITLQEERLPYTAVAAGKRFVICTRKLDKEEDDCLLEYKVEMGAYLTKEEAFEHLENKVVYTILDLKEGIRGPDYWALGSFDYTKQSDIDSCYKELVSGETQISFRHRIPLTHFIVNKFK